MGSFKEHEGSLNREKDLSGSVCLRPFQLMEIQREFYSYLCCPSWLPTIVGNVEENELQEVWNSEKSQAIRASIHDGSFKFCDKLECPAIQSGYLPKISDVPDHYREIFLKKKTLLESPPEEIALCYDDSCNLACPSCRSARLSLKVGDEFERRLKFTEKLLQDIKIQSQDKHVKLRITGSGDPIGSKIFRTSLMSMKSADYPNLEIILQTNGVLLSEKVWDDLRGIRDKIKHISVSVDAGTEETYIKLRKYGSWTRLWQNLSNISQWRESGQLWSLSLNYVVQTDNYREMPEFVQLCRNLPKIDKIFFTFINDWGSLTPEEYQAKCIWKSHHPEFQNFLVTLKDPVLDASEVDLGNIYAYRELALGNSFTELNL